MSEDFVKANEEAKNAVDENDALDIENTGGEIDLSAPEIEEGMLVKLLERERERSEKLADDFLRSQAELQNYRRRKEQEQEQIRARAVEQTLRKLLPVADDFHRALKTLPPDVEGNSWAQGFRMIESNLWKTFESEGVTIMDSVGKPFDPARHEAVMFDENTTGDHMVVEEFQRGYLIHDRVLRPAMVKVGSITDGDAGEDQSVEDTGNQ